MYGNVKTQSWKPSFTDHPVQFFQIVTIATMPAFAIKGGVFEERRVDVDK